MNASDAADILKDRATERFGRSDNGHCSGSDQGIIDVHLDRFVGGVGLWGAVPASYDTTCLPMDRGIHVHARNVPGKVKQIDKTYRAVRIHSGRFPNDGIIVSELEAIYYMISTIFGITPQNIVCPKCRTPHLDQDWYSVHPHREHTCNRCGEGFRTTDAAVGNPIVLARELCGVPQQQVLPSEKVLEIQQNQFRNGILIWGSNPAFLWTGRYAEKEGLHVHIFGQSPEVPEHDDTYGKLQIDGVDVDPRMVRLLMAQQSLPMLRDQVSAIDCPRCAAPQFDVGSNAYTPTKVRSCAQCGESFFLEHEVISNPVLATIRQIEGYAQREPQRYAINLPPYRPAAA